jgi:hypothetical protein
LGEVFDEEIIEFLLQVISLFFLLMKNDFDLLAIHIGTIQLLSGSQSLLFSLELNVSKAPAGTVWICL